MLAKIERFWKRVAIVAIATSLFFSTAIPSAMATEPSGNPNEIVYPERANLPADSFATPGDRPNILYFHVDNLGFGELGPYGGSELRGAPTPNIDNFAEEGLKLTNFAPESQCTPSRSALLTGRYAIRSGNQTVISGGNLVAWEKTIADVIDSEYNSYIVGKWHIGSQNGRLPTDHSFEHWYGVPSSYTDVAYLDDPAYMDDYHNPGLDKTYVVRSERGGELEELTDKELTLDVKRNLDLDYMAYAQQWVQEDPTKPFFLYFNYTLMHTPVVPRDEFKGYTGYGDFADSLAQLDADFGILLDFLATTDDPRNAGKKLADTTIVVFAGDNGPEDILEGRGTSGFFEGSYFAGSEGNLRTPCIIRYPGKVTAGSESNEIVQITDMFSTLVKWAGFETPSDRIIDGEDQRTFFEGNAPHSARDGFPFWNGSDLYGVKWHHYKLKLFDQTYMWEPALPLATPWLINLKIDPKERDHFNLRYAWVRKPMSKLLTGFAKSTQIEPLIPIGACVAYNPYGDGSECDETAQLTDIWVQLGSND